MGLNCINPRIVTKDSNICFAVRNIQLKITTMQIIYNIRRVFIVKNMFIKLFFVRLHDDNL